MASNPLHLSLFELYTAFRSEHMTAGDLTEQAIEQHNTTLGAYKYWQPQDARNAAARADTSFSAGEDHGPLQGIPVSVKDLYNVDGLQTFAGSPVSIPDSMMTQGPVITGLNRQQAVFIGKTHTVEFAYGGLGVNSHWGRHETRGIQQNTACQEVQAAVRVSAYRKALPCLRWDQTLRGRFGYQPA